MHPEMIAARKAAWDAYSELRTARENLEAAETLHTNAEAAFHLANAKCQKAEAEEREAYRRHITKAMIAQSSFLDDRNFPY